ncbi:hypothetical protein Dda_4722 [Drechslerella dactyloides]|uniref:Uncharacterized protein n=1 Tax=Drechslerella dactyloides TaxID=74499 RepID=A0AAD6IXW1_DREDA|nr:hypothetical protein Dda_4722 [Drechslerella dactyloides]
MAKQKATPPSNHERQPPDSSKRKRKKPKRSNDPNDDTPKAFTRLMAYAATGKRPNGLDDPKPGAASKKRKRSAPSDDATAPESSQPASSTTTDHPKDATVDADVHTSAPSHNLTLLPGEKLSDFSRRVDAAIPISFKGLQRGEDNPKNKKKKKEDPKADADATAAADEITEDSYDFDDNGDPLPNHLKPHTHTHTHTHAHAKSRTRKDRSPSPFAILRQQRGAVQQSINDVVQAPPSLIVPKEKLRDKTKPRPLAAGLEVPKSSGSLARREALEVERQGVVERYRAMMAARSGGL